MNTNLRLILSVVAILALCGGLRVVQQVLAQEGPEWNEGLPKQYKSIWLKHDINRPKPRKVDPGPTAASPPSDAIVLFDGTDLLQWENTNPKRKLWDVRDGYMEVNGQGSIRTKAKFGDCQIHVEYRAPTPVAKVSQGRGNSGVIIFSAPGGGGYEVQVLDNYGNASYSDGYIGSVYGDHPPMVNAGRKPGEWQTYDIVFRAPRWEGDAVKEPGRLTVFLNGVLVQHNSEIYGEVAWRRLSKYGQPREKGQIILQDHGDGQHPRFRNIWLRELNLTHEALDDRPAD